jgi:hypothetical protein
MSEINKEYYSEKLEFYIDETVIYGKQYCNVVYDHGDGNVNLQDRVGNYIFNVPKMFLFKTQINMECDKKYK